MINSNIHYPFTYSTRLLQATCLVSFTVKLTLNIHQSNVSMIYIKHTSSHCPFGPFGYQNCSLRLYLDALHTYLVDHPFAYQEN